MRAQPLVDDASQTRERPKVNPERQHEGQQSNCLRGMSVGTKKMPRRQEVDDHRFEADK